MAMVSRFFGNRTRSIFDDPFALDELNPFRGYPSETGIEWKETREAHVFKAQLPGLKKEEVKVEVEDGRMLQISGEREMEKEDKNKTWHRVERSCGKFRRSFRLPENVKVDEVKASMEDGVLTVTVPREEVKKQDLKSIETSA